MKLFGKSKGIKIDGRSGRTRLVSLLSEAIQILDEDGEVAMTLPAATRPVATDAPLHTVSSSTRWRQGQPLIHRDRRVRQYFRSGDLQEGIALVWGLPEPRKGTIYIVPREVARVAGLREDQPMDMALSLRPRQDLITAHAPREVAPGIIQCDGLEWTVDPQNAGPGSISMEEKLRIMSRPERTCCGQSTGRRYCELCCSLY